jgi:hypothetical protein
MLVEIPAEIGPGLLPVLLDLVAWFRMRIVDIVM